MEKQKYRFSKKERITGRMLVEQLFSSGSRSFSVFPLRAVFRNMVCKEKAPVALLISVPKKRLRHAVQRNRVKRQVREAYRKNRLCLGNLLTGGVEGTTQIAVAILYLDNRLHESVDIEKAVRTILCRIAEEKKP